MKLETLLLLVGAGTLMAGFTVMTARADPCYTCCCEEGTLGDAPPTELSCFSISCSGDMLTCAELNQTHLAEHMDASCDPVSESAYCPSRMPLFSVPSYQCFKDPCAGGTFDCYWVPDHHGIPHSYAKCGENATFCD